MAFWSRFRCLCSCSASFWMCWSISRNQWAGQYSSSLIQHWWHRPKMVKRGDRQQEQVSSPLMSIWRPNTFRSCILSWATIWRISISLVSSVKVGARDSQLESCSPLSGKPMWHICNSFPQNAALPYLWHYWGKFSFRHWRWVDESSGSLLSRGSFIW